MKTALQWSEAYSNDCPVKSSDPSTSTKLGEEEQMTNDKVVRNCPSSEFANYEAADAEGRRRRQQQQQNMDADELYLDEKVRVNLFVKLFRVLRCFLLRVSDLSVKICIAIFACGPVPRKCWNYYTSLWAAKRSSIYLLTIAIKTLPSNNAKSSVNRSKCNSFCNESCVAYILLVERVRRASQSVS